MKQKTRKLSIKMKIVLSANLIVIALCLLIGIIFYFQMRDAMILMGVDQAEVAASMALQQVQGDTLAAL
ncbi:MAG: hypothetical protein LUH14_01065 [Clostridiaceae bacterium]|nr:hypothetical protein [Clostridiaceae bacterium]